MLKDRVEILGEEEPKENKEKDSFCSDGKLIGLRDYNTVHFEGALKEIKENKKIREFFENEFPKYHKDAFTIDTNDKGAYFEIYRN